jgi:hypothetical protein
MARKRLSKDSGRRPAIEAVEAADPGAGNRTESRPQPAEPRSPRSLDFSAAEREAILRCCLEYRNRMPTYLQSAQRELKVIDSVIEKCRSAPKGSSLPPRR